MAIRYQEIVGKKLFEEEKNLQLPLDRPVTDAFERRPAFRSRRTAPRKSAIV